MSFNSATARAAALRRWAFESDRSNATQAARDGRFKKYQDQVDPDGVLSPSERQQRAQALMRSDMIMLSQRRAKSPR
jgi:hypothetical protein